MIRRYGPGDVSAIMPRAVCAAAYVALGEKMKFLVRMSPPLTRLYIYFYVSFIIQWDASMKINTVHVTDVCRAIWHLLQIPSASAPPSGTIYNLCDKADTDQGKVVLVDSNKQYNYLIMVGPSR